jgi:hypothetical protein
MTSGSRAPFKPGRALQPLILAVSGPGTGRCSARLGQAWVEERSTKPGTCKESPRGPTLGPSQCGSNCQLQVFLFLFFPQKVPGVDKCLEIAG